MRHKAVIGNLTLTSIDEMRLDYLTEKVIQFKPRNMQELLSLIATLPLPDPGNMRCRSSCCIGTAE